MGDDYERARAMVETVRRGDALGRAMRASIERRIASGVAGAAGLVDLEKGDTMWSFANRVLDAAQEDEKTEERDPQIAEARGPRGEGAGALGAGAAVRRLPGSGGGGRAIAEHPWPAAMGRGHGLGRRVETVTLP